MPPLDPPRTASASASALAPKILIVDDEPDVTDLLAYHLRAAGYGLQLARILRAEPTLARLPIIFLTAKAEADDRIAGLEAGADDYIPKPFAPKEVLLRVQSVLRRAASPTAAPERLLTGGGIVLDAERHAVTVAGRPVELTATEFKLLQLLLERRGRVQTREHLLLNVWHYETEIETRTVDTHVRRLREKLGVAAERIETIRGVGYRFTQGPD
jgi:two-component system, OmpR family, phosphate regulon response regulator PhoB